MRILSWPAYSPTYRSENAATAALLGNSWAHVTREPFARDPATTIVTEVWRVKGGGAGLGGGGAAAVVGAAAVGGGGGGGELEW